MALKAIFGDWGTTNLRLWGIDEVGQVLGFKALNTGSSTLAADEYEASLLQSIEANFGILSEPIDVLLCGMVGSRQGWREVPYNDLGKEQQAAIKVPCSDPRLQVYLLPGLKQFDPADVMRGEETQISGFLSEHPSYSGTLCLPGTHSKWVKVKAGVPISFQTFMTGEIYSLLLNHSTLSFAIDDEWDDEYFLKYAKLGYQQSSSLFGNLFSLRAERLLNENPQSTAAAMSGLLIGAEFRASRAFVGETRVALIGEHWLTRLYALAAYALGVTAECYSGEAMALQGLQIAYERLKRGELCIES